MENKISGGSSRWRWDLYSKDFWEFEVIGGGLFMYSPSFCIGSFLSRRCSFEWWWTESCSPFWTKSNKPILQTYDVKVSSKWFCCFMNCIIKYAKGSAADSKIRKFLKKLPDLLKCWKISTNFQNWFIPSKVLLPCPLRSPWYLVTFLLTSLPPMGLSVTPSRPHCQSRQHHPPPSLKTLANILTSLRFSPTTSLFKKPRTRSTMVTHILMFSSLYLSTVL